MDKDIIMAIIDKFSSKSISKLKLETEEFSIELEKEENIGSTRNTEYKEEILIEEEKEDLYKVKSPLVGIYDEAPGPELEPFVKIGDFVNEGETLYIVEAMKMINEISSPVSGIVKNIYCKNEELVQYDDLVMEIDNNA